MIYLLGDMLKTGSIIMKEREVKILRDKGFNVYSAIEQKDINDKANQTVESNNGLAERIIAKDSKAIRESDIIIGEVDNNNVGSCVEIGQIVEFNWWHDNIRNILMSEDPIGNLEKFLEKYPKKECYFQSYDIRRITIPEIGDRRSYSINQYLYGAILELNKNGIITFDEIVDILVKKKENPSIDQRMLEKLYNQILGRGVDE